jgi:hypothetical protein
MKKSFWNNGVSLYDFEKLLLGFLLSFCVVVGAYQYIKLGDITANWANIIFTLGGFFTVRKVFSYFKNTKPVGGDDNVSSNL